MGGRGSKSISSVKTKKADVLDSIKNGFSIPQWFIQKNLNQQEAYIYNLAEIGNDIDVIKETEKAMQIRANSKFGAIKFWVPKSIVKTDWTTPTQLGTEMTHKVYGNGIVHESNNLTTVITFFDEKGKPFQKTFPTKLLKDSKYFKQ